MEGSKTADWNISGAQRWQAVECKGDICERLSGSQENNEDITTKTQGLFVISLKKVHFIFYLL